MINNPPIREEMFQKPGTLSKVWVRFFEGLKAINDLQNLVYGTTNQITVTDNGDGTITLSLPQDIDTDADVVFDTLTVDDVTTDSVTTTDLTTTNLTATDIATDTLTLDKLIFDLTAGLTPTEGQLCWNADEGTLNLGMPGGNVIVQLGQEILAPRAKAIGSNIDNGDLVYVSGGSGSNPEMTLAKADVLSTSKGTIAMATEDILQNQLGYYTAFGLVRDVDTSAYSPGDQLYLSAATAGAYTDTEPTRPNFSVKIGTVIRAHATEGVIFVNIKERSLICLQQDNVKLLFGAGSDVSMYYDGTDFYVLTDEVAASDLKLDCGTNKTLELQSVVYEDLQVSISNIRIPAANAPTERLYNHGIGGGVTFPVLGFAVNDYLYFDLQTTHAMKLNTVLNNHIHFMTPTDGSATPDRFQFQLDVIAAGINGSWAVPTGSPFTTEHTIVADYTNAHKVLGIADIPSSNTTVSSVYSCKLTRIAATQDEYGSEVYVKFIDSHYQKDTMGSRQETAK